MDERRFDDLAKGMADGRSRRGVIRAGFGGLAASLGATLSLRDDASAAKRNKKNKNERCKPRSVLAACTSSAQCCPKETGRTCGSTTCIGYPLQSCCKPAGGRCSVDCDCCGATSICVGGF